MENLILILDDSPSCQRVAAESLKKVAPTRVLGTLNEARSFLVENSVSLVLLDLHLPDGDGLDFYSEMQTTLNHPDTPVIIVSGSSDICKKVAAFSCGAEDYLVKPYSPMELRARVERIFRSGKNSSTYTDSVSGLTLDFNKFKAFYEEDGEETQLHLTPHEFKILSLFLKNPERIYSREQIMDQVWGHDIFLTPRTVDTHISSLRKKISSLAVSIVTVRGDGYKSEVKKAV